MYENGEVAIKRILALIEHCPKELQAKCFEILMGGYVRSTVQRLAPPPPHKPPKVDQPPPKTPPASESQIPTTVLPRFKATAKRLNIPLTQLEGLFDFNVDPFTLHAVSIPGENNAVKSRNVALLVAARSYLTTGLWIADWQEVKAQSVDQGCYDSPNYAHNLKKGAPKIFKRIDIGKSIELSSGGVKAAESLLKSISGESADDSQ